MAGQAVIGCFHFCKTWKFNLVSSVLYFCDSIKMWEAASNTCESLAELLLLGKLVHCTAVVQTKIDERAHVRYWLVNGLQYKGL